MIRLIAILLLTLALMLSCTKEPICYECRYKDQIWTFCDMTEAQMDSVVRVFNTGCEQDLLICKTIEP